MADPIDELYARWRDNPSDAAVTLALCDALRGSGRAPLIQAVAETTQREHASNVAALIATARMYLEATQLQEAQSVLVAAGKVAPRDGTVYRWLGEVLLRRGDADRAEKVLERAVQLGANDMDTSLWVERAKVFRPMQVKQGPRAVAQEIAKTAGLHTGVPSLNDDEPEETRTALVGPRAIHGATARPNQVSEVYVGAETAGAAHANGDMKISPDDEMTLGMGTPLQQQIPIDMTAPPPKATPPPPKALPGGRLPPPKGGTGPMMPMPIGNSGPNPFAPTSPMISPAVAPSAAPPFDLPKSPSSRPPPLPPEAGAPPLPPYMPPPVMGPSFGAPGPTIDASIPAKKRAPDPRDVLDALQLAGIFEPDGGQSAAAAWSPPDKGPRRVRSAIVLGVSVALFLGSSVGLFRYIKESRAKQHALSEEILAKVEDDLHGAKPAALGTTEQQIGRAFDLDSRSPRAALDWLRERALVGIVKGGTDVAFEDALARAKEVGVTEDKTAFAHVASFVFQGDIAGGAALLPKWDGPAANDAWYQLVAGVTLERAGAPRAGERYAAAMKLDPSLLVTEAMLARAVAIDGDAQKAAELAKAFRVRYPDRVEGVALVSLAWARDPTRGDEPPEVNDTLAHAAELPASLAFVPHALLALRAIDKHAPEDAKGHIEKGLAAADGPGVASWLGTIALETGDETLARKAALAAVGFSAVYPPARVLAARVALLGDRLDEALKATEELEPGSPDVAVVRAAVAYERVDADGLGRALDAVPQDAKRLPFLAPLAYSIDVLFGRIAMTPDKLIATSDDEAPWSDLLAMDMALDAGDVDTAGKIAHIWKGTERMPLRALRLSRLARYSGRLDDADPLSDAALREGTPTVRSLTERVLVLVARGRQQEVGPLLARYPLVLGPLATWLSAYAAASAGKVDDARGKIAQLDPPPATSPLPARVIAALALGATRDRRRGPEYVKALLATSPSNPDAGAAALALGGKRVDRGNKPSVYALP